MSRVRRVGRFLRLPTAERRCLVQAAILLESIWLGLRLVPFPTLRNLLDGMVQAPSRRRVGDQLSADQVVWAVTVASRYLPGDKTCLVQALAARLLLARHGHSTHFHIGVAKDDAGQLQAHAWVEGDGRVLIGSTDDLARYTTLLHLEGRIP